MRRCNLILIEGVPGSGKTTLAAAIAGQLTAAGVPTRLVLEGDLNHPADYEMVAHYNALDFADLLRRFPEASGVLARHVEIQGDDRFVAYRRLAQQGAGLDDAVLAELAQHDVYETPSPETYGRLAIQRWERFVAEVQGGPVVILESCFLQNPLTVLLAKHNLAPAPAVAHLQRLAAAVRPLDPLLVYLWQPDTRATLEHAAAERPADWLNFVIGYVTGQAWGRATGQAGFDGMVAFYEMRKTLELDALPRLGIPTLAVENSDQTAALPAVLAHLEVGAP